MTRPVQNLDQFEQHLTEWLLDVKRLGELPAQQLDRFVGFFERAGFELVLCSSLIRTLHPQVELFGQRWRRHDSESIDIDSTGRVIGEESFTGLSGAIDLYFIAHGHSSEAMYLNSPFGEAYKTQQPVRWRAEANPNQTHYAIFDDLLEKGATDYFAMTVAVPPPFEAGISFATARVDGFPDGFDILMKKLSPLLGLIFGFNIERLSLDAILAAYLGKAPAKRVLGGQMRRGQINQVTSVIGFVNLHGYKEQVGSMNDATQNEILDQFFRQIYDSITPHRGEILKFIGETVLFIFPFDADHGAVSCQAALSAARSLLNASLPGANGQQFTTQVALHYGDVLSGNIGSELRLDFTVMGQAVNLTARLHQLLPKLNERLILSAPFASALPIPTRSLGSHRLKGVQDDQEAFSLDR